MTRRGDEAAELPASIAAIMAAIGAEVTGPARAAVPQDGGSGAGGDPSDARLLPPMVPRVAGENGAKPALSPDLDAAARALLAPMLRDWLDAHLPEIVEAAVHAELRRLTGMA